MKFLRQLSLYTFVGFFNAGISFFLMPYLSHYIDPSGYGVLSMINSLVTILVPLVGLTASGLIVVEYYKFKDRNEYASLFSSVQSIPVIPGVVILFITILFSSSIARFLEIPTDKSYWIPLSTVIAFLSIYYDTMLSFNVIEQRPGVYTAFSVLRLVLEVGLTLLFVSVLRMNWEGRLLSWFAATAISFFISIIYFRKNGLLTLRFDKKYIKAGIMFGLPLIPHTIGKFVINQSDRIFIAKMVSIKEAGIYNIGYQVGMVILLLVNATVNFYQPYLFERLSNLNQRTKLEIMRTTYMIAFGLLISVIVVTFSAPLLFNYLIDSKYTEGLVYVFWVALSYFFWGIYILFAGFIYYYKKTRLLGYLSVINVALNIVLNYFLILNYGAIGAAIATCISFFIVMLFVVVKATSVCPLPWFNLKGIINEKHYS